jgi:hypothetical protein
MQSPIQTLSHTHTDVHNIPMHTPQAAVTPQNQQQQAAAAAPPAHPQLVAALDHLLALKRAAAPQPDLDAQIEAVRALSRQSGADRVIPALNLGLFEGFTLAGRMTKMLGGDATIPLQALSFGLYQPGDLQVRPAGGDRARVFKGPRFGRENTYVISTPLTLEEAGVGGVSHAIATFHPGAARLVLGVACLCCDGSMRRAALSPRTISWTAAGACVIVKLTPRLLTAPAPAAENKNKNLSPPAVEGKPDRLEIRFEALRLEPAAAGSSGSSGGSSSGGDELAKWLGALADANPKMDRATGVLEVAMPEGALPHGW